MDREQLEKLIKDKRREVEGGIEQWIRGLGLDEKQQRIQFSLVMKPAEPKPKKQLILPPDEVNQCTTTVWHLTEDDWQRIGTLSWDENQRKVVDALIAANNGPLSAGDLVASHGVIWKKGEFVRTFNQKLSTLSTWHFEANSNRRYYKFQWIQQKNDYFAIRKIEDQRGK